MTSFSMAVQSVLIKECRTNPGDTTSAVILLEASIRKIEGTDDPKQQDLGTATNRANQLFATLSDQEKDKVCPQAPFSKPGVAPPSVLLLSLAWKLSNHSELHLQAGKTAGLSTSLNSPFQRCAVRSRLDIATDLS